VNDEKNKHDAGIDGAFFSCRKADFMSYSGFGKEFTAGLMDDVFFIELGKCLDSNKDNSRKESAQIRRDIDPLHILFVLPQPVDSNCGYHVARLISGLQAQGSICMVAVPQKRNPSQIVSDGAYIDSQQSFPVLAYDEIQKHDITFNDGRKPDVIHAWTPREGVRQFVTSLTAVNPCPVIVHLEDNEEYLTEIAVGRSFGELQLQ